MLSMLLCFPDGNAALHKVWARASLIIASQGCGRETQSCGSENACPDPWTSFPSRAPSRALRGGATPVRSSHPRGRPAAATASSRGRQSDKTCLGYAPGSKMVIADTLKNCPTAVPMSVLLPLYGTTMTFASMQ